MFNKAYDKTLWESQLPQCGPKGTLKEQPWEHGMTWFFHNYFYNKVIQQSKNYLKFRNNNKQTFIYQ